MSEIIHLHDDPHLKTRMLLPWYVNGTLDADEREIVDAHLAGCAECRDELASERGLAHAIAELPTDPAEGWTRLKAKVDAGARRPMPARRASPPQRATRRSLLGRRVAVGWAVGAQAAMVVLGLGAVFLMSPPRQDAPAAYHALGSAPTRTSGDILVMFQPATTEAQLRADLARSGARMVDGPTDSGAFVLKAPASGRDKALASLKADGHVLLAEAMDGDTRP